MITTPRNSCPDFAHELDAWRDGARIVAGVDEAGRGPLAGPVTAAAVVLDIRRLPGGLNDSKKLTPAARDRLADAIRGSADWAIAHVWVEEIDRLNILQASHLAMCRALSGLRRTPTMALIDGNAVPKALPMPGRAIVKGDARALSIAAASILAKTVRDARLVELDSQFPGYGFAVHKGYPTPAHLQALRQLGPCAAHRRSFAPVRNCPIQADFWTRPPLDQH